MAENTNKTVTDDDVSAKEKGQEAQKAVTGEEEELTEEQKAQKAEEETQKLKEEEEHKERSKLGRRVSAMEQEIEARATRLDAVVDRMEMFLSTQNSTNTTYETDEPLTRKDVNKFLEERDTKLSSAKMKYEKDYLQHISKLGQQEDPEVHEEIEEEMMKNFNVMHSNDPVADAERNYLKATRAILKKASPTKENPLKGKPPKSPLGVGGDTHMEKEKETQLPPLDDEAKDYISRRNLSPDRVKKALLSKTPLGLKK